MEVRAVVDFSGFILGWAGLGWLTKKEMVTVNTRVVVCFIEVLN